MNYTVERDHHGRINWGEANSPLRKLMVGGLIAELIPHIGPSIESDRAELESRDDVASLDGLAMLVREWEVDR